MKLIAISRIKNEIDLVEAFVRHTLAVADRLIVLDNGSTDGTRQLLGRLTDEGLALEIVDDPTPGHFQWQRMTRLMHEAATGHHRADWILPLDCDEFVIFPQGRFTPPTDGPTPRPLVLRWRTHVPMPADDAANLNPVERIRHRLESEGVRVRKVIVPRHLAADPEVRLAQGSHFVAGADGEIEADDHHGAYLAHFPVRTASQYAAKVLIMSLQCAATPHYAPEWSVKLRRPYEILRHDPAAATELFREAAQRYAVQDPEFKPRPIEDPIPYVGGSLRYTPEVDDEQRLAHAMIHLAGQFAEALREARVLLEASEQSVAMHSETTAALTGSWAWRVGHLIVAPLSRLKRMLGQKADQDRPQ